MDCADWEAMAAMLSPLKSNVTPFPTHAVAAIPTLPRVTLENSAPPTHSPAVAAIPTLPPDVLARIAASKKAAEDRRSDRAWEKAKALMASLDQPPSSNMPPKPPSTSPAPESAPATRPLWRDDPNLVQLLAVKEQAALTRKTLQDIDIIERRERKKCRFGHVDSARNIFATGVLLTKTDNEYRSAYLALEEMEKTIEKLEKGYRVY